MEERIAEQVSRFYDQIIREIRYIHLYDISYASLFLTLTRNIYILRIDLNGICIPQKVCVTIW